MSKPKGSVGVALSICALIAISVGSIGYYQFVYCQSSSCMNITQSTSTAAPVCAPPSCVFITMVPGAATLTTTAYSPDQVVLVIGVNNTVMWYDNDSLSGGVPHSATDKGSPPAFDTGVLTYGQNSSLITISKPGTYNYYCVVHPTTMVGTIIVKAA
jgi:plastocyanin